MLREIRDELRMLRIAMERRGAAPNDEAIVAAAARDPALHIGNRASSRARKAHRPFAARDRREFARAR